MPLMTFFFGSVPIPVIPKYPHTDCDMSFAERVVNFDCLFRRRFRFRESFGGRHFAGDGKHAEGLRQSGVGKRISRVDVNRLLEI